MSVGSRVIRAIRRAARRRGIAVERVSIGQDLESDLLTLSDVGGVRTVVDVGANRGQSAQVFLRLFPKAEIYAFEPSPQALPDLRKVGAGNSRLHIAEYALGDREDTALLHLMRASEGTSLLKPDFDGPHRGAGWLQEEGTCATRVRRLDAVLEELHLEHVDLLKIDVQGLEMHVLRGLGNYLQPGRVRMIVAEICFASFYLEQAFATEVLDFVIRRGFRLVDIYTHARDPDGSLRWCDALFVG